MRILQIISQKPYATGSGTYLTGLMRALDNLGHDQYLIYGKEKNEDDVVINLSKNVITSSVDFNSEKLNFPIVGMSDLMPYKSITYKSLNSQMIESIKDAFIEKLNIAMETFKPDLILIQHLYLTTGKVAKYIKENYSDTKIFGFSHGTDLRQLNNIAETRDEIIHDLNYLDKLFFLHDEQIEVFNGLCTDENKIDSNKLKVIGSGFDSSIFNLKLKKEYMEESNKAENIKSSDKTVNNLQEKIYKVVFTGKLCRQKGVFELIDALKVVSKKYPISLTLIGSTGDEVDFNLIKEKLLDVSYEYEIKGLLKQEEISKIYSKSDIFILPSYFEGLPLVVPEAMATGLRAVVTDLPGIKPWLKNFSSNVDFIDYPEMENIDTPTTYGKETFISNIAIALEKSISKLNNQVFADLSQMDWHALANRVLSEI